MIERIGLQSLRGRMNERRKFIQVVVGPRQVGKTTMVSQLLELSDREYIFESADGVASASSIWLTQIWDSARAQFSARNLDEFWIVFDEIQKVEGWSEVIKANWDRDTMQGRNIKVILLGSSRLLIQKGLTESLAGRFEKIYLGHWSFDEMHRAFGWTVEQYIYFGGYPGSASLINDEDRWRSYVLDALIEASISKDILMLTRVNKPALLKRLFELGSFYSGQILSLTKLMGEMQDKGNTTTLTHYLSLLSDSGLLGGISKYAAQEIRSRASQPKFQVYNNALLTSQANHSFQRAVTDPKEWGRLVESSVGAHLINNTASGRYKVYYWRDRAQEVDFIIEYRGRIIGIEVKSGRRATNSGMAIFAEKFHPEKVMVVGTGGIPLEDFLTMNPIDLF